MTRTCIVCGKRIPKLIYTVEVRNDYADLELAVAEAVRRKWPKASATYSIVDTPARVQNMARAQRVRYEQRLEERRRDQLRLERGSNEAPLSPIERQHLARWTATPVDPAHYLVRVRVWFGAYRGAGKFHSDRCAVAWAERNA